MPQTLNNELSTNYECIKSFMNEWKVLPLPVTKQSSVSHSAQRTNLNEKKKNTENKKFLLDSMQVLV